MAEQEEPEVRVNDRRRFSPEGEAKPDAPETNESAAPAAEPAPEPAPQAAAGDDAADDRAAAAEPPPVDLPPASFQFLVMSIAMQAEMELTSEKPNLPVARHAVDTLGVLMEKTEGNLSLEEKRLLENTLTELRFRFVQRSQEGSSAG